MDFDPLYVLFCMHHALDQGKQGYDSSNLLNAALRDCSVTAD